MSSLVAAWDSIGNRREVVAEGLNRSRGHHAFAT